MLRATECGGALLREHFDCGRWDAHEGRAGGGPPIATAQTIIVSPESFSAGICRAWQNRSRHSRRHNMYMCVLRHFFRFGFWVSACVSIESETALICGVRCRCVSIEYWPVVRLTV